MSDRDPRVELGGSGRRGVALRVGGLIEQETGTDVSQIRPQPESCGNYLSSTPTKKVSELSIKNLPLIQGP